MKILELSRLAEKLDRFFHLVIWEKKDDFEVVAILAEDFQDAFPLPMEVQAAAAEIGVFLDTTTAARIQIEVCPMIFGRNSTRLLTGSISKCLGWVSREGNILRFSVP